MADKHEKHVIVPRRILTVTVVITVINFVLTLASFQYTNYVDRRSNGLWCGVVTLFDDTYKQTPPTTETGKILATEFGRIVNKFKCK